MTVDDISIIMLKILQASAVTQSLLGELTKKSLYISSSCNLQVSYSVYMCVKNSVSSRQSYCNNNQAYFFLAYPVAAIRSVWDLITKG